MKYLGAGGFETSGTIATAFAGGLRTFANVAAFAAAGPTTGAAVFQLPESWSDTHLRITIHGFDATTGRFELHLGGINDSTAGWLVPTGRVNGSAPFQQIRFGFQANAGRTILILGDETTSWDSPTLVVAEVTAAQANVTDWGHNWGVQFTTDLSPYSLLVDAELDQPRLAPTDVVRHGVLTPATVTPVTFTSALNTVEIMTVDGADLLWFTVDSADPAADDNDTEVLPAVTGASLQLGLVGTGSHTVKLLSDSAVRYSLRTLSAPAW